MAAIEENYPYSKSSDKTTIDFILNQKHAHCAIKILFQLVLIKMLYIFIECLFLLRMDFIVN